MMYPAPAGGIDQDWAARLAWSRANSRRALFLDIETTGLKAMTHEVLTLSVSVRTYPELEPLGEELFKMRPANIHTWDMGAEKIHGIIREEAIGFDPKPEVHARFLDWLEEKCQGEPTLCVMHALNTGRGMFDWYMLTGELELYDLRYRFLKTVRESGLQSTIDFYREAVRQGLADGPTNYKLSTLCEIMKIPLVHHNAESDRRACEEIYCRLARL